MSEIWRKNQSICKWGYRDSVSHSDYPYKLNNNFKTGGVHNRITNIYSVEPNITDKNLDYFYRVGNFHDANLNSIFYYNQSSNISTDLLNSDHSQLFNIDMYMNSNVDYFTYFFNNKENITITVSYMKDNMKNILFLIVALSLKIQHII